MEMDEVYRYLPAEEVHRVERLEFLDETDLLNQLLQHYCLCWAWKDKDQIGKPMCCHILPTENLCFCLNFYVQSKTIKLSHNISDPIHWLHNCSTHSSRFLCEPLFLNSFLILWRSRSLNVSLSKFHMQLLNVKVFMHWQIQALGSRLMDSLSFLDNLVKYKTDIWDSILGQPVSPWCGRYLHHMEGLKLNSKSCDINDGVYRSARDGSVTLFCEAR